MKLRIYWPGSLQDALVCIALMLTIFALVLMVEYAVGDLVHRHRQRKMLKKMYDDAKSMRKAIEKDLEEAKADWEAAKEAANSRECDANLQPAPPRLAFELMKAVADKRYEENKDWPRCGAGTCDGCDWSLRLEDDEYVLCMDGKPHLMRKEAYCFRQELE